MGGGDAVTTSRSIMRYVSGCITRERQRIAEIIRKGGWLGDDLRGDDRVKQALGSLADEIEKATVEQDACVFQWRPAATGFNHDLISR